MVWYCYTVIEMCSSLTFNRQPWPIKWNITYVLQTELAMKKFSTTSQTTDLLQTIDINIYIYMYLLKKWSGPKVVGHLFNGVSLLLSNKWKHKRYRNEVIVASHLQIHRQREQELENLQYVPPGMNLYHISSHAFNKIIPYVESLWHKVRNSSVDVANFHHNDVSHLMGRTNNKTEYSGFDDIGRNWRHHNMTWDSF